MYIESVTLTNFRCFGPTPTRVALEPGITAIVGNNGSGKTAFIEALRRFFGQTREERTITRADVHFGPDESQDTVAEREVVIDVVFAFPELTTDEDREAETTVPQVFKVMTATAPGEPLKARMRLEALWKRGESFVDEVETAAYWVSHLNDVEFGEEGVAALDKRKIHSSDRGKVQLIYMPATRDGTAVTRQALRQLLRRLERSGDFGDDVRDDIAEAGDTLQTKVEELPSVTWIAETLAENWNKLQTAQYLTRPRLALLSREFTQLLRSLTAKFSPAPDGRERDLEELSEGQMSLFFLALSATLAQLETALAVDPVPEGFAELEHTPPTLTIYAVEEPENHLAPFYLSRLMELLSNLCNGPKAVGLITSHAPGILRRVDPEAVRHFRLDLETLSTHANAIRIPKEEEAGKYVRQAVFRQPELYFANLVILGEGDSEETVLPRLAEALGIDLDPSFVAFAPLGGRHVNHFWRLLDSLDIPHLTILDFDLGRHGAGVMRLKYAYDQLEAIGRAEVPSWAKGDPSEASYWKGCRAGGIRLWLKWFAERGVYFSYPLDLDLMMIKAFPDAYGLPDVKKPKDEEKLIASVFGQGRGLNEFEDRELIDDAPAIEELALYDRLFKKRSKPDSHLAALAEIEDWELASACPESICSLINAAQAILSVGDEDAAEDE